MDTTSDSVGMPELEVRGEDTDWLANTPWWLVSAGIHLVILLVATLFYVERFATIEAPPICVLWTPPKTPFVPEEIRSVDEGGDQKIPRDDSLELTEEKRIIFPGAKESDHNETKDGMNDHKAHGDDLDFDSCFPGKAGGPYGCVLEKNPGYSKVLGPGGGNGGAGKYGWRDKGGIDDTVAGGHLPRGTPATEFAVTAALKWLARHQNPDGSWGARGFTDRCVGAKCSGVGDAEHDTGITGLAILAFLGAGYTHLSKDEFPDPLVPGKTLRFGEAVKTGLKWLLSRQDPEGCIGGRGTKYMYDHTIAALALSEAYGMSATPLFKGPAQQAIDFILAAQNPDRAWRYAARPGDNDTSVTGWAIMALKSAELSELTVPTRESYERAKKWFDEVSEPEKYYRVGYNAKGSGPVYIAGVNETFRHHESMTAVGVLCRIFMSKNKKEPALAGVHLLVADLPAWKPDATDFYYWYYASLALFQYDGPDGPFWKKWNEAMKVALVPNQKTAKDGCANGSWTSENERWGNEGGRVYAVAINALTLEVYYRYPNVFRGEK